MATRPRSATPSISPEATAWRIGEPSPRFEEDEDRKPDQQHRIDGGRHDLEPEEPERPGVGGRPAGDPHRAEREADPGDVREQVAGIGEQREAARNQGPGDFDDENGQRQAEDHDEPLPMGARGRAIHGCHDAKDGRSPAARRLGDPGAPLTTRASRVYPQGHPDRHPRCGSDSARTIARSPFTRR